MVIPSGEAAKTQIDSTIEKLADKIGKYSAIDIAKLHEKQPGEPIAIGQVVRAVAWSVLDDWFYGRDVE